MINIELNLIDRVKLDEHRVRLDNYRDELDTYRVNLCYV